MTRTTDPATTQLPTADPESLELFEWMSVLALALGRKRVTQQGAAVALFVALGSKGTTGTQATVKAAHLATELKLSERQIWRHFKRLCDDGWFLQTAKPTRGEGGERGRVARYRLTHPSVLMSHEDRVTLPVVDVSHDEAEALGSSDTSDPSRLTLSLEPSDPAERRSVTVTPTDDSPTDGSPTGDLAASTTGSAREAIQAARIEIAAHQRRAVS